LRSKRARQSLFAATASASLIVTGARANTRLNVPDGTPNLSSLSPSGSIDLTFSSTVYGTTSYNTGGSALTLGTLDDLDATQDLLIGDAAGSITLNGGSNSVAPAATDMLYVAAGGTLDLSAIPLSLATSTTATLDVAGTANIGTWSTVAGSTYTFTGGGTTNVSGNNTATFLGSVNLSSGTLVAVATAYVGTGTYTSGAVGSGTILLGSGGSGNATIISDQTEEVSSGSISNSGTLSNPITTVAGTTGSLRVEGIPTASGTTATFSGRVTVTGGTTLTLGPGGNTGSFENIMGFRGNPTEVLNGGTLNIDAGVSTGSLPDIVEFASTGTFGIAGGAGVTVNLLSGTLRLASNSSAFNSRFAVVNASANTQFDLNKSMGFAGLNGPSSVSVFDSNTLNYATLSSNSSSTLTSQGTLSTSAVYTFAGQITDPTSLYSTPYPVSIATSGFTGTQIYSGNLNIFSISSPTVAYGTVSATAGTLEFTGNDTFSGTVSLSGGTLVLDGTNTFGSAIGPAYPIAIETASSNANGTLSVNSLPNNGSASPIGTISTLPLGAVSGTGTLLTETLQYTGPTATSNLVITGMGGFAMAGTGTLTLTGQNTYSSTTTVTTTAGPVGGITTLTSGTLDLGAAENAGTSGPLGNGGTISFAGGTLQYSPVNHFDYSPRFSTAGNQAYNFDTNGQVVSFASPLASTTGSLTVSDSAGTGSLTLNASSSFSGTVTVNSGDLILNNASALGGPLLSSTTNTTSYSLGKGSATVNAGALDLNGNSISGERLNLAGAGNGSAGALINSGGAATIGLGSGIGTFLVSNLGSGQTSNGTATITAAGVTGFAATGSIGVASLTFTGGSGYTSAGTVSVTGGGGTGMTVSTSLVDGVVGFTVSNPGTGYTSVPTFVLNGSAGGTGAAITGATLALTGVTVTSLGTANAGFSLSSPPTLTVSGSGLATNATITVSPVEFALNGALTIGGTGNITINDPIIQTSSGDSLTKTGANTLTIANTASYTGTTNVNSGTLNVTGALPNSGVVAVSGPANLVLANTQVLASIASAGTSNFTAGTSIVGTGNGVGTGTSTAGFSGGVSGTGTLAVNGTANLYASIITQKQLTIGSASTVTIADSSAPGNTSATSVLTDITNAGTLDLNNNDLIVKDTTQYSTVKSLIVNAFDGGAWDKTGITSSSARANSGAYGLGYAQASTIGSTSFDGQTFSDAVLVKYTLLGDTQLRGTVGLGDYDTVLSNYGSAQDWSGGDFHYGGVVGLGDYDAVLSNFGAHASGNIAVGPSLTASVTRSISSAASISPDLAKTDLKLEVNTTTGDVYILTTASAAFTGYTISDPTAHLLGGSTSPDPDKLLSVSAGNGGNTNVYETSGTYVDWFKITETASQVAEGQQQNGFGTHSSRDDTINIPAGGTIDFGDIYNTAAAQQDLTFDFAEAGTEPTNGPTYYGAEVDYITSSTPEPASVSLLAIGALGMLGRRRRRGC
jgi:autotransporter-associated beta strand protein